MTILVAVPKPEHVVKDRKRLRPANGPRRRRALAKDFGELAVFVRKLPCCVQGCRRSRLSDPAHVINKAIGHAWLEVIVDGEMIKVGNIAPLCSGHHTGAPDGPKRPQHTIGIAAFERENTLELRLPGLPTRPYATLAEVAAAVGCLFLEGWR